MVTIGVFHNGGTNLRLKRDEAGNVVADGSLEEMHRSMQQVTRDRIRHGVLADEHGFDRFIATEHHFHIAGSEFSPNPMQSLTAIAAQTEDIRLAQVANILAWHDPVRLAEQTSELDIVSDGRVEVGIGRGYQPRENETLGQYWGGTIQDEEKNRQSFVEKFDIMRKAWTEELFSYSGQFHEVPPRYTRWHHEQDRAYLDDEVTDQSVEDAMDWADAENADLDNPVLEGGTTLKRIGVFPQPVQKPYPPVWEPVTSRRSVKFAAENGINGYMTTGTADVVTSIVDMYYDFLERADWPDRRPEYDGEPFAYGWDEERQRGVSLRRFAFNTDIVDKETFEQWKLGVEHRWDFYGPFGFAGAITIGDEHPSEVDLTAETLIERDVALVGSSEEIAEQIVQTKADLGFEGFSIDVSFEVPGLTGEEADAQLETFGEEVMPLVREQL
ncbi:MAG: LLM class flavin-dependent oxidoreductase [Haloarculaceae archaeon]